MCLCWAGIQPVLLSDSAWVFQYSSHAEGGVQVPMLHKEHCKQYPKVRVNKAAPDPVYSGDWSRERTGLGAIRPEFPVSLETGVVHLFL